MTPLVLRSGRARPAGLEISLPRRRAQWNAGCLGAPSGSAWSGRDGCQPHPFDKVWEVSMVRASWCGVVLCALMLGLTVSAEAQNATKKEATKKASQDSPRGRGGTCP